MWKLDVDEEDIGWGLREKNEMSCNKENKRDEVGGNNNHFCSCLRPHQRPRENLIGQGTSPL